jgi:hypothetical protein
MKTIFATLICLLVLGSCGGGGGGSSGGTTVESHVGTWKVDNIRCAQGNISIEGLEDYLVLGEYSGSNITYGSACYVSVKNFGISNSGSTFSMSGGLSTCSSDSCLIPWKLQGPGGSSFSVYSCPDQAGAPSGNWTVEDGNLKLDMGSGCWMYYSKITTAAPTVECLSTEAPVSTYTAMGILSNNSDKGAMQFQVSSNKTLRAIQVMMTSDVLSSAQILLYEGGAQPEAGTLVGTATVNQVLGNSASTLHVFEFVPGVNLTAGTDYYAVIRGTGTGSVFDIGGNTQNLITAGAIWSFNGSSWTSNAGIDLAIGFVYEETGCP